MNDLRWHVEVRGRTQAEINDKVAFQDALAFQKSWSRAGLGEIRQDGDEWVLPVIYERFQTGPKPWFVFLLLAVIVVGAVAMFFTGQRF